MCSCSTRTGSRWSSQSASSEVLEASRERAEREVVKRGKLQGGALSYDLDGLRDKVEAAT